MKRLENDDNIIKVNANTMTMVGLFVRTEGKWKHSPDMRESTHTNGRSSKNGIIQTAWYVDKGIWNYYVNIELLESAGIPKEEWM
ncbi:hypothetical protein [uncultured Arcobacter sp.]|uniref:hypothetical protein n=1 Tax=uncultured Arcobacter sp. TaxID=165434 RepID=UPI00260C10E8|nr:hypothetical protein [uncultured Arcobacter sp.]